MRSRIERLNGCTLVFEEGETNGVGLFPLIAQTIQNIHTGGLRRVTFALRDDQFWMSFEEREERCAFPVGMRGAAKRSSVAFHGEAYELAASGKFTRGEHGALILDLDLAFLEIPNRRRVQIVLDRSGEALVRFWETPGVAFIRAGMDSLLSSAGTGRFAESVGTVVRRNYPPYVVREIFEPECAASVKTGDTEQPNAGMDGPSNNQESL